MSEVAILLAITIINLLCVLIHLWLVKGHRHEWTDWSEWIEDIWNSSYALIRAVRYRTCQRCVKVEEQSAGDHHCLDYKRNREPCTHLSLLIGNENWRIKRLEKELGFDA